MPKHPKMALIEGLDFQLVGVDYDEIEENMLRDTFVNKQELRQANKALWDFLDYSFDQGAREPIDMGVEMDFQAAKDYCKQHDIVDIPPLYKAMFDAGAGFLTRSKMPYYMAEKWVKYFPEPIKIPYNNPNELTAFKQFLSTQQPKYKYASQTLAFFCGEA